MVYNEEQHEQHYLDIVDGVHEIWDRHDNSCSINAEQILWALVYGAVDNAFHSGLSRSEINSTLRKVVRIAHEVYEEECGEFDRSES